MAKEFCLLLGGTISLESELDKGSEFTIAFPFSVTKSGYENDTNTIETTVVLPIDMPLQIANLSVKPAVLIVEDSLEVNTFYKALLSDAYSCSFAFDGLEGIKMAQNNSLISLFQM